MASLYGLGAALEGGMQGYMKGDKWRSAKDAKKERRDLMSEVRDFMQGASPDGEGGGEDRRTRTREQAQTGIPDIMASEETGAAGPQERNLQRNPGGRAQTRPLEGQQPGDGLTLSTVLQDEQGPRRKKPEATGRGEAAERSAPGSTRTADGRSKDKSKGNDGGKKPSMDIAKTGKEFRNLVAKMAVSPEIFREMQPVLGAARQNVMARYAQEVDGDVETPEGALDYAMHMAQGAAHLGQPMDIEGAKTVADWAKKIKDEGYREALQAVHVGDLRGAIEGFNARGGEQITEDQVVSFRPTIAEVGGRPVRTHELVVQTPDGVRRINGYEQMFNAMTIEKQDELLRENAETNALINQREASATSSYASAGAAGARARQDNYETRKAMEGDSRVDPLGYIEGPGGEPVYVYSSENGLPTRSDGRPLQKSDLDRMRPVGDESSKNEAGFENRRAQELRQFGKLQQDRAADLAEEARMEPDPAESARLRADAELARRKAMRAYRELEGVLMNTTGGGSGSQINRGSEPPPDFMQQ